MRSLRVRLVLLSTLLSGVVIVALASVAWVFMIQAFEERADLEMRDRFGRMFRDLHPRLDLERYSENLRTEVEDEVQDGRLLLRIRDDINDQTVFEFPSSDWFASMPEDLLPELPDPLARRPEFRHGEGPKGPPGERTKGDNLLLEELLLYGEPSDGRPPRNSPKGPKGKGAAPGNSAPQREYMEFGSMVYQGKEWRILVLHGRGYGLVAAMDSENTRVEIAQLRTRFVVTIPIALGLIALGGWFVADRALRPIRAISKTASNLTARGLSERITAIPHSDAEITELIDVLNEMMNGLEESFEHANRFSADVSHELKTPIAIMQGEVENALKEAEVGSREHANLVVIRQEIQRLKEITKSLMLLAKADVGKLILRKDPVDLSEEISGLAEDAEILAIPQKVRIETEIDSDLIAIGDEVLLRQALLNLISNAIKYNIEDGSVTISLREIEENQALLVVENTGPTIPEEDRERIFERFHRVDKSRSRNIDGFGLGLSLAREIIRGHGGELCLMDSDENLTRFQVTLPLRKRFSNEV